MWSERNQSSNIIPDETPSDDLSDDIQTIGSYETFRMGAQKRGLLSSGANNSLTSSPDRKKSRLEVVSDTNLHHGDFDGGCPSIEDTAMFIQYRVMSYAIKVHQNQLNGKRKFPPSSTNQAKSFWKGSNRNKNIEAHQKSSSNNKPDGLHLAREILHKSCVDTENNESIIVKNISTDNDFCSISSYQSSYQRFLTKQSSKLTNLQLNHSCKEVESIDEQRVNKYVRAPTQNEIQLYFLPEVFKSFIQHYLCSKNSINELFCVS